jgi:hypothetical protein
MNKCVNCPEHKRCRDSWISWVFFLIGLIATIAVRIVTILVHVGAIYGQIAWYVGVIGFFIFFAYKFKVEHERSILIKKSGLMEKMSSGKEIGEDDRELISSVLCAISSEKDRINYLFIFVSSAVVLALAIYMDFIK